MRDVKKILERGNITLKTGKWYDDPWWQDDKYYEDGLFTRKDAETAFNELKRVFNADWVLEQRIPNSNSFSHPFMEQFLLPEGLPYFQFLYSLGLDLYTVRRKGLIGNLERRLTNPKEYWESAAFELKFLSKFLQHGFNIERNYPSGKGRTKNSNCDFKISKGNEIIFVEVKRLREFHQQNIKGLEKVNRSRIESNIKDAEVKSDFSEPLIRNIEINKVFYHIRNAVKNQLPDEGHGIVIIELPQIIENKEIECALRNRLWNRGKNSHQKYAHLSAICLVKVFFDTNKGSIRNNISIILNPKAKIDVSNYDVIKVIRSLN
jgi:hypothetical protein